MENDELVERLRTIQTSINDLTDEVEGIKRIVDNTDDYDPLPEIKDLKEQVKEMSYQMRRNNDLIEKFLNQSKVVGL